MSFTLTEEEKDEAVTLFKTIITFPTISFEGVSNGSYIACVNWLYSECSSLKNSEIKILTFVEKKPILFVTIQGEEPELEGVLLNSHYDVVPIMKDKWNFPAFEGFEDKGRIYGRGTQDMKCVCVQYIMALRKLQTQMNGKKFRRNIYLSFVPDEEIGGKDGMLAFVESDFFKELKPKVGICFDEGIASETEEMKVFYGERASLWIEIYISGPTGHGSRFIKNTATEKLTELASKAFELRREQEKKLQSAIKESDSHSNCNHSTEKTLTLGDVLTLNLTMLDAGVKSFDPDTKKTSFSLNVIPTEAAAGFDIRVPVCWPLPEIYDMLDKWCDDVTKGEFDGKENGTTTARWRFADTCPDPGKKHFVSDITLSKTNPFWNAFVETCRSENIKFTPQIFPAGTDSRYLRAAGLQAFGFSPIFSSEILLHEHNEYLDKHIFTRGVEIYAVIFNKLFNL